MSQSEETRGMRRWMGVLSAVTLSGAGLPVSAAFAALIAAPTTKSWGSVPRSAKRLGLLLALGAALILVSAEVNDTAPSLSYLVNFALVGLFVVAFLKISPTIDDAVHLAVLIAAGSTFAVLVFGRADARGLGITGLWKYGLAAPVSVLLIAFVAARFSTALKVALMVGLAGASIGLGFRSHGLVVLAAAAMTIVMAGRQRGRRGFRIVVATGALLLLAIALPKAMAAGTFGPEIQQRTVVQSENGPLLLAGRTEPPLSVAAISARPLLGWGDIDMIDGDTKTRALDYAYAIGLRDSAQIFPFWFRDGGARVSLHSVTFEAMATGGIAAGLFGLYGLLLFSRAALKIRGTHTAVVVFTSFLGMWNLVFSPWGGTAAIMLAASLALAIRVGGRGVEEDPSSALHDVHERRV